MRLFRIADKRRPLWDGSGAAQVGGRWNSPGRPVIYASLSYSCAMLEILAHAGIGRIPATHSHVIADVPDDVAIERRGVSSLPSDWDAEGSLSARVVGDRWLEEGRTAILIVPSVVARLEWNALVNPLHPDAVRLVVARPEPVIWDRRLFTSTTARTSRHRT